MQAETKLAQSVAIGTLYAYYGGLLTERQRDALRLHFNEDCSLGEIAEQFGVSRQNVHELITRSVQKLERYEGALHLASAAASARDTLTEVLCMLERAQRSPETANDDITAAIALLRKQGYDALDGEADDHGV